MKHLCTFTLLLLFFGSCQKANNEIEPVTVSNSLIESLKQWIEAEKKQTVSKTSEMIGLVQQKINWEQAYSIQNVDKDTLIVIPYGKKSHRTNSRQFVARVKNNQIQGAYVLVVVTLQIDRLNEILSSYEKRDLKWYKGHIDKFDISYRIIESRQYKEKITIGKLVGKKHLTSKRIALQSTLLKTSMECIDWYWETYVDGVLVSSEYVYTTCTGEQPCWQNKVGGKKRLLFKLSNCDNEEGGGGLGGGYTGNYIDPKICRSSFQFKPQGEFSDVNNAKIWGIPAGVITSGGITEIKFGLDITAPTDVTEYPNFYDSFTNYFNLWDSGDIANYTDNNGKKHYYISEYAQQVIAADACDFASLHADEKILVTNTVYGGEIYKDEFVKYFNQYMKMYSPGSIAKKLNAYTQGATLAKLSNSNGC